MQQGSPTFKSRCKISLTREELWSTVMRSYDVFPSVPHDEHNNSGHTCVDKHTVVFTGREADRQ